MPEYLAPGVFVEEVSFRQKTIEGVSTSTAGFVGPTRFGPVGGEPELLTSFADFERIYGGLDPLDFTDGSGPSTNFLTQGVRAFFEEGGRRLYVSRVFGVPDNEDAEIYGRAVWQSDSASPPLWGFRARYPGRAGNAAVTCVFRLGENILDTDASNPGGQPVLRGAAPWDTVWAVGTGSPPSSPPGAGDLYWLERVFDEATGVFTFRLRNDDTDASPPSFLELTDVAQVRIVTVSVIVERPGRFAQEEAWEGLGFHPQHRRSLSQVFAAEPSRRSAALTVPLVFETTLENGAAIADEMMAQTSLAGAADSPPGTVLDSLDDATAGDAARSFRIALTDGFDGERPVATEYQGREDTSGHKTGLVALEDVEDVSIVAAPGSTFGLANGYGTDARAIQRALISHCERMRYRVAVLDSGDGQSVSEVRELRAGIDTTRAALYYPWVRSLDPVSEAEVALPPSGFLAGIWARSDIQFGVHKSPANEVVRLANGFEQTVNTAQQEVLNPLGVNCLRYFEGRGNRVWGARTATSDPEWKYLNVRRYFAFLERSIERGTQWAVFENNGPVLWANVRSTIEDFLFNEFRNNHLLGSKPAEAYFVRCDRTTMTQNDLDNGRLVCLIGVAPLRPAEFVIFRIGQKTADSPA